MLDDILMNSPIDKKVGISNSFNKNINEMSILEGQFLVLPTPCSLNLQYYAGLCMGECSVLLSQNCHLISNGKSGLILHFWMLLTTKRSEVVPFLRVVRAKKNRVIASIRQFPLVELP